MDKPYIICSAVKYKNHIIHGRRHSDAYETLKAFLPKSEYETITRDNTIAGSFFLVKNHSSVSQ